MAELLVSTVGSVTMWTLNRPERRNALSRALLGELADAVADFSNDPAQRVGVLTGAGEAFSSGGDLDEIRASGGIDSALPPADLDLAGLSRCPKPTIAALNGYAVGGGLELALSCDIRLGSEGSWVALFEVTRGIVPAIAARLLPRLVPYGTAMDLLLTGDRLSITDALRLGLVQAVLPRDSLVDAAVDKARVIASHPFAAVIATKRVADGWRDAGRDEQTARFWAAIEDQLSR